MTAPININGLFFATSVRIMTFSLSAGRMWQWKSESGGRFNTPRSGNERLGRGEGTGGECCGVDVVGGREVERRGETLTCLRSVLTTQMPLNFDQPSRSAAVCDRSANIKAWHRSESWDQDGGWSCQAIQITCQRLTSTNPHIDFCHRPVTSKPQTSVCCGISQGPDMPLEAGLFVLTVQVNTNHSLMDPFWNTVFFSKKYNWLQHTTYFRTNIVKQQPDPGIALCADILYNCFQLSQHSPRLKFHWKIFSVHRTFSWILQIFETMCENPESLC